MEKTGKHGTQKLALLLGPFETDERLRICCGTTYGLFERAESTARFGSKDGDIVFYNIQAIIGVNSKHGSKWDGKACNPEDVKSVTFGLVLNSSREGIKDWSQYVSAKQTDAVVTERIRDDLEIKGELGEYTTITVPSAPLIYIFQAMRLLTKGEKLGARTGSIIDDIQSAYNLVKRYHEGKSEEPSWLSDWRKHRKISRFIKDQGIEARQYYYSPLRGEECIIYPESVERVIEKYLEPFRFELENSRLFTNENLPADNNGRTITFGTLTELIIPASDLSAPRECLADKINYDEPPH